MKLRRIKEYTVVWHDGTEWKGDDPEWYRQSVEAAKLPGSPIKTVQVCAVKVLR